MIVTAYWLMFKVTVFDYINVHDMWLLTRLNFLEALSIPSPWSLHVLAANHLKIIGKMPSRFTARSSKPNLGDKAWSCSLGLISQTSYMPTSRGNMRINKTTHPVDFITPSTHGLHQCCEDMSTLVTWLWWAVHGGTFIIMSMATCFWQLVDRRFIHGNLLRWFRTLSSQIVRATIPE